MLQSQLASKLEEINRDIDKNYKTYKGVGLLSGLSGLAMFKFYYGDFIGSSSHKSVAEDILYKCVENINNGFNYPTFCAGIAGMGWTFDHLQEMGYIDNNDDLLSNFDEHIYRLMISEIDSGKYDYLHESLGYAQYFFKRFKNARSVNLKKKYENYIVEFLKKLKGKGHYESNKIKWISALDYNGVDQGYNLSLSHGISSIINFLSRVCRYNEFEKYALELLKLSCNYLISQKDQSINKNSIFPDWIDNHNIVHNSPSRVGWCYGDLGICITIWNAYKTLSDPKLKVLTIELLESLVLRRNKKETLVNDAGVCHGSFGNGHIFLYMSEEMKLKGEMELSLKLKETSDFWFKDGLSRASKKRRYAGFQYWEGEHKGWNKTRFLLNGTSGIGLCILSNLKKDNFSWSECLLIS